MLQAAEDLVYESGGHEVPARLYHPEAEGPRPGVLLCPGRLREIEGLEFLARACGDLGMVVLATRYRGMDMRSDDADCRAGLDVLSERPDVAPGGFAMVGHSRGAMASLRVAASDERVRAVVAIQPVTDFAGYVEATRLYAPSRYEQLTQSLGATPDEDRSRYDALSALHLAHAIRIPVLLVAGSMDLHSPLDHSRWMHQALIDAGNGEADLEILDGVGHFFEKMYAGYECGQVAGVTTSWLTRALDLQARS